MYQFLFQYLKIIRYSIWYEHKQKQVTVNLNKKKIQHDKFFILKFQLRNRHKWHVYITRY